jgi:hypothetical protein
MIKKKNGLGTGEVIFSKMEFKSNISRLSIANFLCETIKLERRIDAKYEDQCFPESSPRKYYNPSEL